MAQGREMWVGTDLLECLRHHVEGEPRVHDHQPVLDAAAQHLERHQRREEDLLRGFAGPGGGRNEM